MREYYDKEKITEYLERYDKLKYFSDEILTHLKITEYDSNEYVYLGGDEICEIKFLIEGTVLVTQFGETGSEAIVCLMTPFNILGELEIILDMPYLENNVQAKCKCLMISVATNKIIDEMNSNPQIHKIFNEQLAKKLKMTANLFAKVTTHSLEQRYIELLDSISSNPEVIRNLTQKDIASLLGVSARQLRRVIKKISEEKE